MADSAESDCSVKLCRLKHILWHGDDPRHVNKHQVAGKLPTATTTIARNAVSGLLNQLLLKYHFYIFCQAVQTPRKKQHLHYTQNNASDQVRCEEGNAEKSLSPVASRQEISDEECDDVRKDDHADDILEGAS